MCRLSVVCTSHWITYYTSLVSRLFACKSLAIQCKENFFKFGLEQRCGKEKVRFLQPIGLSRRILGTVRDIKEKVAT